MRSNLLASSRSLTREASSSPSRFSSWVLQVCSCDSWVCSCSCSAPSSRLVARSSSPSAWRCFCATLSPSRCSRCSVSCFVSSESCSAFSFSRAPSSSATRACASASWPSSRCRSVPPASASTRAILAARSWERRSASAAAASAARRWLSAWRPVSRSAESRSWALSSCSTERIASMSDATSWCWDRTPCSSASLAKRAACSEFKACCTFSKRPSSSLVLPSSSLCLVSSCTLACDWDMSACFLASVARPLSASASPRARATCRAAASRAVLAARHTGAVGAHCISPLSSLAMRSPAGREPLSSPSHCSHRLLASTSRWSASRMFRSRVADSSMSSCSSSSRVRECTMSLHCGHVTQHQPRTFLTNGSTFTREMPLFFSVLTSKLAKLASGKPLQSRLTV
mmetsp:Transcript_57025/g.157851  ORF Transcript_57025/g.157851 Transcript_57025/m.157851 type:complete len:400 (+) Transcript_57025:318-1517(+)